jgi:rubrerythrin
MEIIYYLNHTAQVLSAAADIVTSESTEAANLIRSCASARTTQVTHLYTLDEKAEWPGIDIPSAVVQGYKIDEVKLVLQDIIDSEIALQASIPKNVTYQSEIEKCKAIKDASGIIVDILQKVLYRLEHAEDDIWICQNCLTPWANEDTCTFCGSGRNWAKPWARF